MLVEEIHDYSALDPLPLRAPSPRMRASLTGADGKLVLFGGSNPNNDVPTNTLWVYDIGGFCILFSNLNLSQEKVEINSI